MVFKLLLHVVLTSLLHVALFDVPINYAVFVEKLQGEHDLGRVETRARLVEFSSALDLEHEITSVDVLHHEEKAILRRKNTWLMVYEHVVQAF